MGRPTILQFLSLLGCRPSKKWEVVLSRVIDSEVKEQLMKHFSGLYGFVPLEPFSAQPVESLRA